MGTITKLTKRGIAALDARPTDTELVGRALGGDERASESLFRRHANAVNGLAFRLCPRESEAEDLVQEAFALAFERLPKLRDRGAFGAWVRGILVRTTAKHLRRAQIARRIGLSHSRPYDTELVVDPRVGTEAAVELRRLYARLHAMPGNTGVALVLKRVEGMTIAEVAAQMGVSEPTVKRYIKRAEAQLGRGP